MATSGRYGFLMSKVLDISLRHTDMERYLGQLLLDRFALLRKIEVLEARVDELDGPDEKGPNYA